MSTKGVLEQARAIAAEAPPLVTISPPNLQTVSLRIVGTAPYMQAKFSAKARQAMMAKQAAGSTAKKGAKREARDFDSDFRAAQHRASEGWAGIPAAAIRNACIDACRMVGYQMTRAKMSIFVQPDGFDIDDGTPLVRLIAVVNLLARAGLQVGIGEGRPFSKSSAGLGFGLFTVESTDGSN